MNISASHIRKALIQIAEKNSRPYFDVVVQRDVINAFRHNRAHALKNAVLGEKISLEIAFSVDEYRIEILKKITKQQGMASILARAAELDPMYLGRIIRGEKELSDQDWIQLQEGIKRLKVDDQDYKIAYKYELCGTLARYKYKKCRCTECVTAYRTHEAMRSMSAA